MATKKKADPEAEFDEQSEAVPVKDEPETDEELELLDKLFEDEAEKAETEEKSTEEETAEDTKEKESEEDSTEEEGAEEEETAAASEKDEDFKETPPEKQEKKDEQPSTPEKPETPTLTPEEQEARLAEFFQESEALLAKEVYQMTEEQAQAFEDNPQAELPKLAARLHMQVLQASVLRVAQLLPELVSNIQQQQSAAQTTEQKFYEAWPDLAESREVVQRIGSVYAQMNPNATVEDFIKDVGAQAMVATGKLDALQQPQKEQPAQKEPHKPAAALGKGSSRAETKPRGEFAILATLDEP